MKEIPLTQGKVAIVDDEDYKWASKYKWYFNKGYAVRKIRVSGVDKTVYLHREILHTPDGVYSDHINTNKLDNRKTNLRLCTFAENLKNRGKYKDNKSGFKGVFWCSTKNKWRACIRSNFRFIHIGYFENKIDAALAYDEAASKYHGKFAKLNFS